MPRAGTLPEDKAPLAHQLGAHHYIDNAAEDPAAALTKLGGAKAHPGDGKIPSDIDMVAIKAECSFKPVYCFGRSACVN